jgi:hypothetical protein
MAFFAALLLEHFFVHLYFIVGMLVYFPSSSTFFLDPFSYKTGKDRFCQRFGPWFDSRRETGEQARGDPISYKYWLLLDPCLGFKFEMVGIISRQACCDCPPAFREFSHVSSYYNTNVQFVLQ